MNYIIHNNWSNTASTTANITISTINSTSTATYSLTGSTIAEILPLREPGLESQPGWLSPEGEYYAVDYPRGQRHPHIASGLIDKFLPSMRNMFDDDQILLQNNGWIRIDVDMILPKDAKANRKQRDVLKQLCRLEGDFEWGKSKGLIETFLFMQSRKKKNRE